MNTQEELKAYVDGELSQAAADQIRRELETDDSLRNEATLLRILGQEIRELAKEPVVVGAEKALAFPRKRSRFQIPAWGFVGLLALLIIPGALLQMNGFGNSDGFVGPFGGAKAAAKKDIMRSRVAPEFSDQTAQQQMAASAAAPYAGPTVTDAIPLASAKSVAPTMERMKAANSATGEIPLPLVNGDAATSSQLGINDNRLLYNNTATHVLNRMVVKNGSIGVRVDDVSQAESECENYVVQEGGIVQNSSLQKGTDNAPVASLTVQVPAPNFTAVMDHVKGLAKDSADLITYNTTGNDVTSDYVDASARMSALGAEEDSEITMLHRARNTDETLAIRDRLTNTREQIDSLHARAAALKNTSAMSTIQIDLRQRSKDAAAARQDGWAGANWSIAVDGLYMAGRFLGTILIYLFVLSPIWVPLLTFGWFASRRAR